MSIRALFISRSQRQKGLDPMRFQSAAQGKTDPWILIRATRAGLTEALGRGDKFCKTARNLPAPWANGTPAEEWPIYHVE